MGKRKATVDAATVQVAAQAARGADVARAESLVTHIQSLQRSVTRTFWDMGAALRELRDDKLHVALGFERFDAFVEERLGMSQATAWKLLTVAQRLPKATATELGQEKAYALIAYSSACPDDEDPVALAASDAEIGGKPLSTASVRDIVAATRAVRVPRPARLVDRASAEAERRLELALKRVLKERGLGRPTIEVRGDAIHAVFTRRQVSLLVAD